MGQTDPSDANPRVTRVREVLRPLAESTAPRAPFDGTMVPVAGVRAVLAALDHVEARAGARRPGLLKRVFGGSREDGPQPVDIAFDTITAAPAALGWTRARGRSEGLDARLKRLQIIDALTADLDPGAAAWIRLATLTTWAPSGRGVEVWLPADIAAQGFELVIVGPHGPATRFDLPRPQLLLRECPDEQLQFEIVAAPEGVSLLYHDAETIRSAREGHKIDAIGRATFGRARLKPGDAAYRMGFKRGHTVVQPLPPYDLHVHYQSNDGEWSK